ncbi:MAG: class I SAM-dependent methyltransferase [Desulfobacter sp.]|nr:MAG: class I SAM-dependent methyltransferase [Desulfobacter sp.]
MNIKTEKSNASSYCDYNDAFTGYDHNRQPNGLKEILALLGKNTIPVQEQTILEGGFGTGAYIDHIRHSVKRIFGVEGSEQGYEQTVKKTKGADNVRLQIGNILDLSFEPDLFDGYMVNQVLHHLDTEPAFPNLDTFIKEGYRVLKPGGILTINTSSQEQLDPLSGVYWNYKYIEQAARAMRERYVPVDDLISRLTTCGFTDIQTLIPSGKLFQGAYYDNPDLALTKEFQKADSVYCFLSEEEINAANTRLAADIADGTVYRHMAERAEKAATTGEAIIVSARKPG